VRWLKMRLARYLLLMGRRPGHSLNAGTTNLARITSVASVRILVLEGDGIGPEICASTVRTLTEASQVLGIELNVETALIGFAALQRHGTTFPSGVLEAAREADGVVLGPVSHNEYPAVEKGGLNPSGLLRKELDLYANIRPARTWPGLKARFGSPVDLVIVRENTEGFYSDRSMYLGPGEIMPDQDLALSFRKISRAASARIAESAFALARRRRKHVTAVHKANVLRVSDGLFLDSVRVVASRYPDVGYQEKIVDAMAALLVRDASQFDVIVSTNMFGDILSDEAAEIAGGLGLAASLNAGCKHAVAQAQHGSAPDLAGRGIANPTSLIGSAAMLLRWIGERRDDHRIADAAQLIEKALGETLANPAHRTVDLDGPLDTVSFTDCVIARIRMSERRT
jgi:isocitrate dehydrogenase (NAD+)